MYQNPSMRSTSLDIATWGTQLELPTFTFLQMANQFSYFSFHILLIFLLNGVQSDPSQPDFPKWNSTRWMEVGHNRSGIEWWLMGSRSPRLFAWQPNHGDRGPTYTREPKSGPKFSHRYPQFGDPDSFPPGFNQTMA